MKITSNPLILYYIGKYCAKSNFKLELGLVCLGDFKSILKFIDNYNLSSLNEIKNIKAIFWKGVIYILQKQHKLAKEKFEKIQKLLEINEKYKKTNFIRKYYEWYIKNIANSRMSESFSFDKNEL